VPLLHILLALISAKQQQKGEGKAIMKRVGMADNGPGQWGSLIENQNELQIRNYELRGFVENKEVPPSCGRYKR